jgi:hypothetical protein
MTRLLRYLRLWFVSCLLFFSLSFHIQAQQALPTTTPAPPSVPAAPTSFTNNRLGFAHISAAEGGTPETRYQQARALGAVWNRYPIYWDRVEIAPGTFDWRSYDVQVSDDLRHGFKINAILLGRPTFRAEPDDNSRIQGLNEPIFSDGSDYPGAEKTINPGNPWATYVYETVNRYKPGGVLAQQGGIALNSGISVWEVWNEPDFELFWSAGIPTYARLLKVAYLAAHHADPNAQVMFAGLLYNSGSNWLAQVLKILVDDPYHEQFNWYIDQVAVHSYSDPWRTGWLVLNVRQTLIAYGLERPIWVTETGVAVWDDYPGPTWAVSSTPDDVSRRRLRATQEQQGWFVIQSAAYAWSEGADVVIFHQLYDDCGDQPAGTNFPPHDGSICQANANCQGDAHGFFRNWVNAVCFSQSPQPGTPRSAAKAYQLLAQLFNRAFEPERTLQLGKEVVALEFRLMSPDRLGERLIVMWNRTFQPVQVMVPSEGSTAQFITLENAANPDPVFLLPEGQIPVFATEETVEEGTPTPTPQVVRNLPAYAITLAPAYPDNYSDLQPGADAAIGGPPVILLERRDGVVLPMTFSFDIPIEGVEAPPVGTVQPTPGSVIMAPTTDPANDTVPPLAELAPLPTTSPATFTVSWQGSDNSGIVSYTVWVRENGQNWRAWMETTDTRAEFSGQPGILYEFDIWAVDLAGNWSSNIDLQPRTSTTVQ